MNVLQDYQREGVIALNTGLQQCGLNKGEADRIAVTFSEAITGAYGLSGSQSAERYGVVREMLDTVYQCDSIAEQMQADAFWNGNLGQVIAETQFWLYYDERMLAAEAARFLYDLPEDEAVPTSKIVTLTNLANKGVLVRIRRPEREFYSVRDDSRRKTANRNQSWFYVRSDMEAYKQHRQAKRARLALEKSGKR